MRFFFILNRIFKLITYLVADYIIGNVEASVDSSNKRQREENQR